MKNLFLILVTLLWLVGCTVPEAPATSKQSNGANGVNGQDGSSGINGEDGANGVDGINGNDGVDGSKGEPGEPGPQGDPGEPGNDGKDGEPAIDAGTKPESCDGKACTKNEDCTSSHCNNGYCCASGTCCATKENCAGTTPICTDSFQCVGCDNPQAGTTCATHSPSKPQCLDSGACGECKTHRDCRWSATATQPYLSPIGACTGDNTCTCAAPNEKWSCNTNADCATFGADFVCQYDFYKGVAGTHQVCLRKCNTQSLQSPSDGIRCNKEHTDTDFVWLPVVGASCFSMSKTGDDCTDTDDKTLGRLPRCRVHSAINDSKCEDFDTNDTDLVFDYRCTTGCWNAGANVPAADDNWCEFSCHVSNDQSYCNAR